MDSAADAVFSEQAGSARSGGGESGLPPEADSGSAQSLPKDVLGDAGSSHAGLGREDADLPSEPIDPTTRDEDEESIPATAGEQAPADSEQTLQPFAGLSQLGNISQTKTNRDAPLDGGEMDAAAADPNCPQIEGYTIRGPLGSEGMGDVYRAYDKQLRREVALKIPKPISADVQEQFLAEARSLASFSHPNIVGVHSFGRSGGHVYFTMDLIEGLDGSKLLKKLAETKASRLSGDALLRLIGVNSVNLAPQTEAAVQRRQAYYRLVATWIAEAAEGMHAAHSKKILHRDIKPSNLLLASDGRMMVADFGLAKPLTCVASSNSSSVTGTYPYIAPERAAGDWGRVDHRADIWALGATLYEFLAFRRAYPRRGKDVLQDIITTSPASIRGSNPDVPAELERICLKAMSRNPDDRYPNILAMARELRAWATRRRESTKIIPAMFCIAGIAAAAVIFQGDIKRLVFADGTNDSLIAKNAPDEGAEGELGEKVNPFSPVDSEKKLAGGKKPKGEHPPVTPPVHEPVILLAFNEDRDTSDDLPAVAGGEAEAEFRKMLAGRNLKLEDPLESPSIWNTDLALDAARQCGANVVILCNTAVRRGELVTGLQYGDSGVQRWTISIKLTIIDVDAGKPIVLPESQTTANRPPSNVFDGHDIPMLARKSAVATAKRIEKLFVERSRE